MLMLYYCSAYYFIDKKNNSVYLHVVPDALGTIPTGHLISEHPCALPQIYPDFRVGQASQLVLPAFD
jgi:hypothetical protein